MKIDVQPLEDHQVKVTADFDSDTMDQFMRRAARKLSRQTKIPGFRPGKAPYEIIRRQLGEETLQQQSIEDIVDEFYPKILEEANIKPGASGTLDEIISIDPLKLAFIIPLEPEVNLGNYRDIRLDYIEEPVTDTEVDEFLERLRTNYSTAEPVERPAENGDLVYVKFSGKLTHPAEGEDEMVYPQRPAQFIIGTDIVEDRNWPYPGFADTLIGLSVGDEKTTHYTFPDDEADEAIRGKEVEFSVTVQSIKALKLPDLNDEFAQTVGQFDTLEDLRKIVREQLEASKRNEAEDKYFTELIDKVVEGATIKYPPQMLEHEIEHTLLHFKEDLASQGLEYNAYLKMIGKDERTLIEEEIRPATRKRIERSLVMEEIARVENIQLEQSDYDEAISNTISQIQAQPQPRKAKERISSDLVNSLTMNELSRKLNQKVLERMKAIATDHGDEADATPLQAEPEPDATGELPARSQPEEKVETETAAVEKPSEVKKQRRKAKPETAPNQTGE